MKQKLGTVVIALLAITTINGQENNLPKEIKVGTERIKARKEIKMPQIPGYTILKCDFHMHTIFSDGIVWPTLRVDEAWEEGLDAIAITDHIEGQPARPAIEKGNHNNSYNLAKERALESDILLIRAGEITRSMPPGHLNALFLTDVNALDKPNYMDAIEEANKQGAFVFWNHPGWGVDQIKWHAVHDTLYQKGWLHGIEVYNEFEWYPVALNWANEKNLTLISNTDTHDVIERLYDFRQTRHRPMTLVLARDRSEASLKEALFAHRTILYFYDTLIGSEANLTTFFNASIQVKPAHHTTTKRQFVHLSNLTDVAFKLRKTDASAPGYPETIHIPAGATIRLALPVEARHNVAYEVENLHITPTKNLQISLF
ncbi:Sb-PDE family phosphodiesterase [Macellibacteroides fermentans]|uniref:Sb-PDE family phosphodiesterase n=1 Tax=Macellibacteroides fermentans TaxID=879969 RepID=UPI00352CDD2B